MAITFNAATATSTFADLFTDSDANTTWYQVWTGNAAGTVGSFVDTSKFNSEGKGWIQLSDLSQLEADFAQANDDTLWVRAWNATDGESAWASGGVTFTDITGVSGSGGPGNVATLEGVPVTAEVHGDTAMDEMFNIENFDSDTWVRIWVGDEDGSGGSYLDTQSEAGNGWVKADQYGTEIFTAAEAGSSKELWVTLWNNDTKYSGWEHWTVSTAYPDNHEFALTLGTDNLTGTSGDDDFVADLGQNPSGGVANTLSTADTIDGGAGNDELMATLIPEFTGDVNIFNGGDGVVAPETDGIEVVKFQVQQDTTGNQDAEQLAGVDAGEMTWGGQTAAENQLWTWNSRADLVVEDVRVESEDLTIGMNNTSGASDDNFAGVDRASADLDVFFDPEYLSPGVVQGGAQFDIYVNDTTADDLATMNYYLIEIPFVPENGGTTITKTYVILGPNSEYNEAALPANLDPTLTASGGGVATMAGATYNDFLTALEAAFDADATLPVDRASLGVALSGRATPTITQPDGTLDDGGQWLTVTSTDPDYGFDKATIQTDENNVLAPGNNTIVGEADETSEADDEGKITTSIILNDVGNDSDGGYLNVGSTGTYGVQRFEIVVGDDQSTEDGSIDNHDDSSVASLSSINRSQSDGLVVNERLEEIKITEEDGAGRTIKIGNSHTVFAANNDQGNNANVNNVNGGALNANGNLVGNNNDLYTGLWNVRAIESDTYTGNQLINLQLDNTADVVDGVQSHVAEQLYLDPAIAEAVKDARADATKDLLQALYENKVVFDYALGSGADEFVIDINDAADSLLRDHVQWTQDAITEMKIDTGAGDDLLLLDVDGTVNNSAAADFQTANPAATSVTTVDGGAGTDTFEISHSVGVFGDALGTGRSFYSQTDATDTWFDETTNDNTANAADYVDGFKNFEILKVSDRLDDAGNGASNGADVYVELENMTWNNGADKIGGYGVGYYEITNSDLTFLDHVEWATGIDARDEEDWATDLYLTGGDGDETTDYVTANVGDVILSMEENTEEISTEEIHQNVYLKNTGRSGDVLTVNSITYEGLDNATQDDIDFVHLYSMGSSLSNSNVINGFEATSAQTLFIMHDDESPMGGKLDDGDQDYSDEDLTITLVNTDSNSNVDVIDASNFVADLTLTGLENNGLDVDSGLGDDTISTGSGDDDIEGGAGDDVIISGAGDDEVNGDAGDDILRGVAGEDDLDGGAGNDEIFGGAGDDEITGGTGNDEIIGGAGADTLDGGAGADVYILETATDSQADDDATTTLYDTIEADAFDADGDSINIASLVNLVAPTVNMIAEDRVDTDDENGDAVVDANDTNTINEATLITDLGNLFDSATPVNDGVIDAQIITATAGDMSDAGGADEDMSFLVIDIDDDGDIDANDVVIYMKDWDGTTDTLVNADIDITTDLTAPGVTGLDMNSLDFTTTEPGNAYIADANGDQISNNNAWFLANAGAQTQTVTQENVSGYLVVEDAAGNKGFGVDNDGSRIPIYISNGNNLVGGQLSGSLDEFFFLGAGDTADAGDGNDHIKVDLGGTANGEAGDDTILFDDTAATINGGTGIDTLQLEGNIAAAVDLTAGLQNIDFGGGNVNSNISNIENVDASDAGAASAWTFLGNDVANVFIGGAAADTFTGMGGNDTFTGGAGDDTFNADVGTDTITDLSGGDILVVSDNSVSVNATVTADWVAQNTTSNNNGTVTLTANNDIDVNLTNATVGDATEDGYTVTAAGNAAASILIGSTADDTITGGSGNDTLTGLAGDDTIVGGNGDDTILAGVGADTITGGDGADDFQFDIATDAGDTITDFATGTDDFELVNTGLVDNAGNAVGVGAIAVGSFDTFTGADAGSAAAAVGDVIIELDQASLGLAIDFSTSTSAEIVTAVEALFAGNNWNTGGGGAAYVETVNSEDLIFAIYENAGQGTTADAILVRATGDGAADSFDGEITHMVTLTGVAADALVADDFVA